MSEWVRTADLADLIDKHWYDSKAALARRLNFDEANIRRITNRKTVHTTLNRAEKILEELGCLTEVDIEIVILKQPNGHTKGDRPWLFNSETARAAVKKRWLYAQKRRGIEAQLRREEELERLTGY